MNEFGYLALFLAWALSLYGFLAGAIQGFNNKQSGTFSLKISTILTAFFAFLALGILAYLFLNDDYTNQYVWQHSNREMPKLYKFTAIWGGMDGSMLLWAGLLCFFSAIVAFWSKNYEERMQPWLYSALNSSSLFFLTVVLFFTNPFRYIMADFIPPEGNGLNPLLQNPYMAIHPPMLYLGFTAFAVPYAFCIAALASGQLQQTWLKYSCRWTLIAWGFLTAGITLGGHWAYLELGWGGFWAWDPVENSSFLPWLTGTAYLHSVLVQEKKGLLKVWNILLIVCTYGLTVFGTFLTRSGIVQSVHAFASTNIGWIFLIYLGLLVLAAVSLIIFRWKLLQPEQKLESIFSREVAFLLNNLLFISICFATFWGVMFPVFSEAITGTKQAVGIPFFNAINVPLFLIMLFLMALGPLVAWRKSNWKQLKKIFLVPLIVALVLGLILIWCGIESVQALIAYTLVFLVISTVIGEYHRGVKKQQGVKKYFKSHRRQAAGYLVHIGVAVATLGITASMAAKVEEEFSIPIAESYQVGEYTLELNQLSEQDLPNYNALVATVTAYRNDLEYYTTLEPELRRYKRNEESTTEVALKMGLKNDLYLVLAGLDQTGQRASFKVFINPLQVWLWFGVIIMIIGTLIIVTDRKLIHVKDSH